MSTENNGCSTTILWIFVIVVIVYIIKGIVYVIKAMGPVFTHLVLPLLGIMAFLGMIHWIGKYKRKRDKKKLENLKRQNSCPICNLSEKIKDKEKYCPACNGKGFTFDEKLLKMYNAYKINAKRIAKVKNKINNASLTIKEIQNKLSAATDTNILPNIAIAFKEEIKKYEHDILFYQEIIETYEIKEELLYTQMINFNLSNYLGEIRSKRETISNENIKDYSETIKLEYDLEDYLYKEEKINELEKAYEDKSVDSEILSKEVNDIRTNFNKLKSIYNKNQKHSR